MQKWYALHGTIALGDRPAGGGGGGATGCWRVCSAKGGSGRNALSVANAPCCELSASL
jgi:hypothetical protein